MMCNHIFWWNKSCILCHTEIHFPKKKNVLYPCLICSQRLFGFIWELQDSSYSYPKHSCSCFQRKPCLASRIYTPSQTFCMRPDNAFPYLEHGSRVGHTDQILAVVQRCMLPSLSLSLFSGWQGCLPDGPELSWFAQSPVLSPRQSWEWICDQRSNCGTGKDQRTWKWLERVLEDSSLTLGCNSGPFSLL